MARKIGKEEKMIIIKLPYDIYVRLVERSRVEGYKLLSDYIKSIIMKELGLEEYPSRIDRIENQLKEITKRLESLPEIDYSKIETRLLRKTQDLINPVTAEISRLSSKIADIVERLESVEEKIGEIEKKVARISEVSREKREIPHRKTGIERLKEEGAIFESELRWLRNKDRFFAYLEREGAKIIEAKDERIAVDRDFWSKFTRKLFKEISTSNDEQIKIILTKTEYKLFTKLKESGLIYYDSTSRKWKPVSKELIE